MLAQRQRYVRLDDAITAATFAHFEQHDQQRVNTEVQLMMLGPGVQVPWIETQSAQVRDAIAVCEAEADATIARLAKELGVRYTGKMEEVPLAAFQMRRMKHGNHTG